MSRRGGALFAAVGGLLVLAAAIPGIAPPAAADVAPPTVTVAPVTGLTDGAAVTIVVKSTPGTIAQQANASICRAGVDYQAKSGFSPPPDTVADGPNCPRSPISSSSDGNVTDQSIQDSAATSDGESFLYHVGSGVQNWTNTADNTPQSLECDQAHNCDLVVELKYSPGQDDQGKPLQSVWKPYVFEISYASDNPLQACGAPPDDPVASGGGDRMQDAWIAWSLGACKLPDAHGAPTRASFIGEGQAVSQFSLGVLDLAYTAGGYDAEMAQGSSQGSGLITPDVVKRPSVAIPIGLNAAVLAVGGGQIVSTNGQCPCKKIPYKTIEMTVPEMAEIITSRLSDADKDAFVHRDSPGNAQLAQTGLFDLAVQTPITGYADAEAFSWYATRMFKALAPDQWRVADVPSAGDDRGKPRGIDANLGQAQPEFSTAMPLSSGRPSLIKNLFSSTSQTSGGVWVLTDLITANALSLTPVSERDGAGNFVTPNAASVTAAVPNMKADDQGILVSDPTNTAPNGGVQPYPTAFVEYALAPLQPLLNDDCTPRSDAQKELTSWLSYITGDGQAKLPAGMIPLTDDLKTQAAGLIAQVGTAPVTGACANVSTSGDTSSGGLPSADTTDSSSADSTTTEPPPDVPPAASPASAAPITAGSMPASPVAHAVLANAAKPAPSAGDLSLPTVVSKAVTALVAIPRFLGRRVTSSWGTIIGLLGIVALTMGAMTASSRRR